MPRMEPDTAEELFVVFLAETPEPDAVLDSPSARMLAPGLYLVRSRQSQSQLYHQVKRRMQPQRLFVARLQGDPKFKGMEEGALKWVRANGSGREK